ncbi:MAG TPA: hypothetical protein VF142_11420 [Longimicrobium sp.]
MLILSLSYTDSLLHLVFAVVALLVGRRLPEHAGSQRPAWQMTGLVFVIFSAVDMSQLAFGTVVFVLGPEHPLYGTYLRWAPIANHSRTLVVWSLYIVLAVLAFRGMAAWPRLRRVYPVLAVAMLVAGGMIGWVEGPFDAARHLSNTSLMDVAGFLALSSLLFVLMLRDTVDRALWIALACYGTSSVMSSLFLAAIAWINAGTWTPAPWIMEGSRVVFTTAMVTMAVWRLRRANRGAPLAGLLGTNRPRPLLA